MKTPRVATKTLVITWLAGNCGGCCGPASWEYCIAQCQLVCGGPGYCCLSFCQRSLEPPDLATTSADHEVHAGGHPWRSAGLGGSPGEAGGSWGSHWGTLVAAIFGSFLCWSGWAPSWDPPSSSFKPRGFFFFFWLRWVFVAVHGLSLAVASVGYSSLRCAGFSLQWLLLLGSTGSRCAGFSSCGTRAQ